MLQDIVYRVSLDPLEFSKLVTVLFNTVTLLLRMEHIE